jgi:hypothetical protein
MRDQPFAVSSLTQRLAGLKSNGGPDTEDDRLQDSLWIFDGTDLKVWTDMDGVSRAIGGKYTKDLPELVSIPVDFYPLSTLLGKATVLGVETDLVQRRDINFSFFRFSIRVCLIHACHLTGIFREANISRPICSSPKSSGST